MRWSTNWSETVRAAGLAALAERTASTDRARGDMPNRWDPYEVWLSRAQPTAERADPPSAHCATKSGE
jgi:hypothetical protein